MTQVHFLLHPGGRQGDTKEETGSGNLALGAAATVHGSPWFCRWPLSLGVLIIYAGEGMEEGTAHRADHVQTYPLLDISQCGLHAQNQECGCQSCFSDLWHAERWAPPTLIFPRCYSSNVFVSEVENVASSFLILIFLCACMCMFLWVVGVHVCMCGICAHVCGGQRQVWG